MAGRLTLEINRLVDPVSSNLDSPLLYVLHNEPRMLTAIQKAAPVMAKGGA